MSHPQAPRPIDLTEGRAVQLAVLDRFAHLCDERGYRWWLCAGTLLGAARHRGFIPWDDDVDVAMPRQDFDRLCRDDAPLPAGTRLSSLQTDGEHYLPYAKLYDPTTLVVAHYDPPLRFGLGVDVFPVDDWPDGVVRRRALEVVLHLLRGMLGVRVVDAGTLPTAARQVVARIGRVVLTPVPPRRFAQLVSALVGRRRTGSSHRGVIVWGYEEKVPRAAFAGDTTLPFEGVDRPVPAGWEAWLTSAYGDWRTPPPLEEQRGHPHLDAYRVGAPDRPGAAPPAH